MMMMLSEIGDSIKALATNNSGGGDQMMQMMMMMMMMGGGGGGAAAVAGPAAHVRPGLRRSGGGCGKKGW